MRTGFENTYESTDVPSDSKKKIDTQTNPTLSASIHHYNMEILFLRLLKEDEFTPLITEKNNKTELSLRFLDNTEVNVTDIMTYGNFEDLKISPIQIEAYEKWMRIQKISDYFLDFSDFSSSNRRYPNYPVPNNSFNHYLEEFGFNDLELSYGEKLSLYIYSSGYHEKVNQLLQSNYNFKDCYFLKVKHFCETDISINILDSRLNAYILHDGSITYYDSTKNTVQKISSPKLLEEFQQVFHSCEFLTLTPIPPNLYPLIEEETGQKHPISNEKLRALILQTIMCGASLNKLPSMKEISFVHYQSDELLIKDLLLNDNNSSSQKNRSFVFLSDGKLKKLKDLTPFSNSKNKIDLLSFQKQIDISNNEKTIENKEKKYNQNLCAELSLASLNHEFDLLLKTKEIDSASTFLKDKEFFKLEYVNKSLKEYDMFYQEHYGKFYSLFSEKFDRFKAEFIKSKFTKSQIDEYKDKLVNELKPDKFDDLSLCFNKIIDSLPETDLKIAGFIATKKPYIDKIRKIEEQCHHTLELINNYARTLKLKEATKVGKIYFDLKKSTTIFFSKPNSKELKELEETLEMSKKDASKIKNGILVKLLNSFKLIIAGLPAILAGIGMVIAMPLKRGFINSEDTKSYKNLFFPTNTVQKLVKSIEQDKDEAQKLFESTTSLSSRSLYM